MPVRERHIERDRKSERRERIREREREREKNGRGQEREGEMKRERFMQGEQFGYAAWVRKRGGMRERGME
jgi:hypothetical protein